MRSLHLRGVAGNAKLRGKRTKLLSCRCCCVQDLRPQEFERQVRRELREFAPTPSGAVANRVE